jgi:hypothetical protein
MAQTFDLPIDVPWSLVAASPDMMDTTFCDDGFPQPWQSSLAIYAYEPSPDDLPQQLCDQRITYLKVTCSITGFQPTQEETNELYPPAGSSGAPAYLEVPLPNVPTDILEDLTDPYWACYGVLLNVAVFPSTTTLPQAAATQQQYSFAGKPATLANPFSDAGLTFSAPGAPNLRVASIQGTRALGVARGQLQIDMPLSTNVVLQMSIRNRLAQATITAFQGTTAIFTTPVPKAAPGVQDVPIATNGPITQIVINQTREESFLLGLSYDLGERTVTLDDYPHIIDFEPKTRDLYQAATDQSEVLTGSNTGINTGKSLANTSSSQMGLSLSGGYAAGQTGGPNISAGLTGLWGNTTADSSSTQIDQSRDRRETQGTTTNITQQYNLLTGYHAGTNRATFLMLPRPHTLQATDYRTFVRGLRMIEGVQEFFLIVSRPKALSGICVEAALETGHFPESVSFAPPLPPPTVSDVFKYSITAGREGGNVPETSGRPYTATLPISLGGSWTIDTTQTSQGQQFPGIAYSELPLPGKDPNDFTQAQTATVQWAQASDSQGTLTISGMTGGPVSGIGVGSYQAAWMQVDVQVWATQPAAPADSEPQVVSPFLVTSRDLCVCINSCEENNCVMIVPPEQVPYSQSMALMGPVGGAGGGAPEGPAEDGAATPKKPAPMQAVGAMKPPARAAAKPARTIRRAPSGRSSIVYEAKLKLPRYLFHSAQMQKSRTPAARELMHQIQYHMLSSWRRPQRRRPGSVGFVDSDYVCERVAGHLPKSYLSGSIGNVRGLSRSVIQALGAKTTVGDLLKLELHHLGARAGISLAQAIAVRRKLLGLGEATDKV